MVNESRLELSAHIAAAQEAADAEASLADLIATAVRMLRRDRALAEALGERFGADFGCDELQNQLSGTAAELVRRGQAAGRFRGDVRPETYGALMRGLPAAALSRDLQGLDDETAARCLVQTLVGALRVQP